MIPVQINMSIPLSYFQDITKSIIKDDAGYHINYDMLDSARRKPKSGAPVDIRRKIYKSNGEWLALWPIPEYLKYDHQYHHIGVLIDDIMFQSIDKDNLPQWIQEELTVQAVSLAL